MLTCWADTDELWLIVWSFIFTEVLHLTDVPPWPTTPGSNIHQQSVIDCSVVGVSPLYLRPSCTGRAVVPCVTDRNIALR